MNRSVLVVDDIAANRNLLSETLEAQGYEPQRSQRNLDVNEPLANLLFGEAVEALVQFVAHGGHRVVLVEVQPVVLGAGQVEEGAERVLIAD